MLHYTCKNVSPALLLLALCSVSQHFHIEFTPPHDADEVGKKSHLRHEKTESLVFLVPDQGQI